MIRPEELEMARFLRKRLVRSMRVVEGRWSGDSTSIPPLLPFDYTSTDAEIQMVLRKRDITWINCVSGRRDSATVGRFYGVDRRHDWSKAYITFTDRQGFHSVYLSQIVEVS